MEHSAEVMTLRLNKLPHQAFLMISFNRSRKSFYIRHMKNPSQSHDILYQITYIDITQRNECEQRSSAYYTIKHNRNHYRKGSM